ncbi:MAG: hypothetical protein KQH57_12695 [Actinomycetales bacterium]|nr:hypothetical protein [Actinomycetales bacterium]
MTAARLRRGYAVLRRRADLRGDDGNAVVEFLGVALVLLIPTVYLVLVLGRLQAAAFAVDGAAREAVRAALVAAQEPAASDEGVDQPDEHPPASLAGLDPSSAAAAAVGIALADQGLPADDAVSLVCTPACDQPGATVIARVEVTVDLPLIPAFVQDRVPLAVPVSASATGRVDQYLDAG